MDRLGPPDISGDSGARAVHPKLISISRNGSRQLSTLAGHLGLSARIGAVWRCRLARGIDATGSASPIIRGAYFPRSGQADRVACQRIADHGAITIVSLRRCSAA